MQGDGVLEKFWPRMVPSCFPQASNQNGKNHFHSVLFQLLKFLSLKEMLNNYLLNEYSMCCLYIHCIEISVGLGICAIYMNGSPGPEFTGDLFLRRSNMDEVYHISSTEKVQQLERELAVQLAELKAQIEDNGVLQGTPNRAYRYQSFSGE